MQVYVYGQPSSVLTSPVSGQYIVPLKKGDIVDVVLQNLPGNASSESPLCAHLRHSYSSAQQHSICV